MEIVVGIFLFFSLPFAFLSLLMPSRRPLVILWNFSWYFIMAQAGEFVFQNPRGQLVGIFFGVLYTVRIIFVRQAPVRFHMATNFGGFKRPSNPYEGRPRGPFEPRRPSPPKEDGVIDVEYTDETGKIHEQIPPPQA